MVKHRSFTRLSLLKSLFRFNKCTSDKTVLFHSLAHYKRVNIELFAEEAGLKLFNETEKNNVDCQNNRTNRHYSRR